MRLALLVGCLAICSLGVAPRAQPIYYGAGLISCGQWLAARDAVRAGARSSDDEPAIKVGMASSWMQGFAFGAAIATPDSAKMMRTIPDHEAVLAWTDKFCRERPLDNIARASAMLVAELIDRVQK